MDEDASVYCLYELARFPRSAFEATSGGLIHKVTPPHFSTGPLVHPSNSPGLLPCLALAPFPGHSALVSSESLAAHLEGAAARRGALVQEGSDSGGGGSAS